MYPGRSTTRRICAGALALAAFLFAPASLALQITATYVGSVAGGNIQRIIEDSSVNANWTTLFGGQMELQITAGDYSNADLLPGIADRVYAYCLEPQEGVATNTSYTWQVGEISGAATNIGGIGVTKARHIQDLLYHIDSPFTAGISDLSALALQISLWEIARETVTGPYSVTGGKTHFRSEGVAGAMALAQNWLDLYVNDGTPGPYNTDLLALTKVGNQDLMVQRVRSVALPPSLLLLLPLLLWLLARRLANRHTALT